MTTRRPSRSVLTGSFAAALITSLTLSAQTKLLRFPDLHGDQVVFCHGGDLWRAPAAGGDAIRITSHPGEELFPKFSPDGKWIAFTGQLDGDEQVYVVRATGGTPRQLTYYPAQGPLPARWGYDNQVMGFTPDGKRVLFRSLRDGSTAAESRLYTVSVDGGLPTALPMPRAGAGCFAPDGQRVCYSPLFRDFRTWKRYQGGWAQDLWIFDTKTNATIQITKHPRSDRDPMWVGDSIYFTSDRTGTLNLYRYDVKGGASAAPVALTDSTEWDVRWPAAAPDGRVVFQLAGELAIYDPEQATTRKLSIRVPTDDLARRPRRESVAEQIADFQLSPNGKRLAVAARGDIFTVPVEHGTTRNLTRSPGHHDKAPSWSHDGKQIAFLSDRTGEEQIWLIAHDGKGEPRQLTKGLTGMLYGAEWSHDGKWLAFGDKDGVLRVVEVATGEMQVIADEERGQLRDFRWSPKHNHIALRLSDPSSLSSIWLWTPETGAKRVTDELGDEFSPTFSQDGTRLFFLARRRFAPRIGNWEWNYQLDRMVGVYALALRKDAEPLFPARSDEAYTEAEEDDKDSDETPEKGQPAATDSEAKADEKAEAEKAEEAPNPIDWDGLADRVERVPVPADNYGGLAATGKHLLFYRSGGFYYGRGPDRPTTLQWFGLEDRKTKSTFSGMSGYDLTPDGKHMVVLRGNSAFVIPANPGGEASKKDIDRSGLVLDVVPIEEWTQMFHEVWRRFRDFFYAENMHGYDWAELRSRYGSLLAHVSHRSDLNYLIGEMIGELNAGHAYIAGGDQHRPDRPTTALPGARFVADASGKYRIARILHGDNTTQKYRSPLTEVGVHASVGDYLIAIDGEPVESADNPYRLLRHKGGQPVTLTLSGDASGTDPREVTFRPLTSEQSLLYFDRIRHNREYVRKATDGRVGYLHIPDMGANGIAEFLRWFYPQIRKQGLVIDVRGNGGGNVSQMIIERLRRQLLGMTYGRTSGVGTYPGACFHGHLVCLLNENSASDGDIFPAMFRRAGLGPLVGKRSWGGIIGITNRGTLIDGGTVNVPEFANTEPDGEWTIEGVGVPPDHEVTNDPKAVIEGRDQQLDHAIELVEAAIRDRPKQLPARPADPVRK